MAEKDVKLRRDPSLGLLVVIGGPGGSGSSTISKLIAQKYNLSHYYAGGIFRQLSIEEGYSDVRQFLEDVEKKKGKDYDLEVDNRLIKMSQSHNVLIEAKAFAALATIKNIPCTIKIWIDADLDTRVRRVLARENILGYGEPVSSNLMDDYDRAKFDILSRQNILTKRLGFLYGIDYTKPEIYNDIIIDSSKQSIKETFDLICKYIDEMEEKTKSNVNVPINGNGKNMEDLEINWRRWKCLICGYLYEGTDIQMRCPKCGNEDKEKFMDVD